jgi:iron complex outermembrane receptor protein
MVPDATIASPTAPPADDQIVTSGGNVLARWQHVFSETSSIEARFSSQRMFRDDPQTTFDVNTLDYGFQQHKVLGSRQDVIWGVTFRQDSMNSTPTPALRLNPLNDRRYEAALFAQDEISLIPDKLHFIAGMQASRTENFGYALQPTARLLWTPTATLSTWIAVSRAQRTPSLSDVGLDLTQAPVAVPSGSPFVPPLWAVAKVLGNPLTRSETVLAYEAGQRLQANKRLSFDLSTFYNVYQHLIGTNTGAPVLQFNSGMPYLVIPVTSSNDRHGESYGAELAPTWTINDRWRLTGGYSWLRVETRPYAGDTNLDQYRTSSATPHHQWEVRSYFDLTRTVQIDTALYYYAAMLQTGIPQHLRGDLRIGWRPSPKVELSIGVQDAFEAYHLEYESTRFNQISQVPRNFYGRMTWRF